MASIQGGNTFKRIMRVIFFQLTFYLFEKLLRDTIETSRGGKETGQDKNFKDVPSLTYILQLTWSQPSQLKHYLILYSNYEVISQLINWLNKSLIISKLSNRQELCFINVKFSQSQICNTNHITKKFKRMFSKENHKIYDQGVIILKNNITNASKYAV